MPMVSIITPAYNRQNFIAEAIQSVINQTWTGWEMIIIDDGSTDNTVQIVKEFIRTDRRIKLLVRTRDPKGAATCRNIGIEHASGDYIIFLDSDDLLRPFALEQRLRAFRKFPHADFLVFQTEKFHGTPGNIIGIWNMPDATPDILRFLNADSPWHTSGPIWRAEAIHKHNLRFDEKLLLWQDVDFHLQALIKGLNYRFMSTYPADVLYRIHTDTISQRGYSYKQRRSQIYFIRKYFTILKDNVQARSILNHKASVLLKKNLKSRYWDNTLSLILWKIFKQ